MLNLTAYTEPALANVAFGNTAVNELSQFYNVGAYDPVEYEPGEFQKLLSESLYKNKLESGIADVRDADTHVTEAQPVDSSDKTSAENKDSEFSKESNVLTAFIPVHLTIYEASGQVENDFSEIPDGHINALTDSDTRPLLLDGEQAAGDLALKDTTTLGADEAANLLANVTTEEDAAASTADANVKTVEGNATKANVDKNAQAALDASAGTGAFGTNALGTSDTLSQVAATSTDAANAATETNEKKDTGIEPSVRERVSSEKAEASSSKDAAAGSRSEKLSESAASLNREPQAENAARNDDTRRSRRDRLSVEVRDMRTGTEQNTQMRPATADTTVRVQDSPVREITLELRLPEGQSSPQSAQSAAQTTWEAKSSAALENMLARELHQNFNGDIVRHASMALKDGGAGIIRLALKPDSLGNVKIALELSENKITGRIIVESEEALNAFKKEIASLEQAFKESGYTEANLDLSLTGDGRNAQEQEAKLFSPGIAASRYDDYSLVWGAEQETTLVNVFIGQRPGSINILA